MSNCDLSNFDPVYPCETSEHEFYFSTCEGLYLIEHHEDDID